MEIITTSDGSHTLRNDKVDETYHSLHGAISESMHVFIDAGFRKAVGAENEINILEMGFGTGLNALLTCLEGRTGKLLIHYIAIDPYPLPEELAFRLNYGEMLGEEAVEFYRKIIQANWVYPSFITNYFVLNKIQAKLEEIDLADSTFDLVYFDAFSPEKQPELWTSAIFRKLHDAMKPGGILTTYSSKGSVKRALTSEGYDVEKIPGPAGKREMLRAYKISKML